MLTLHLSPILLIQAWLSNYLDCSPLTFNALHASTRSKKVLKASLAFLILFASTLQACSLYVSGDDVPEPVQVVESQTNILLTQLSSRKKEFDNDPKSLIFFAKNVALSHWDLTKTSRLMLGKYWRVASNSQQLRFEEEFLRTLMRYVVKAYGFYDESFVKVISYDWKPKGKGGWVKSVVQLPAGLKVSVDYRMMVDKDMQWKLIDVRVEGISLVGSKRSEYRGIIRTDGIEELLKTMFDKNEKVLRS